MQIKPRQDAMGTGTERGRCSGRGPGSTQRALREQGAAPSRAGQSVIAGGGCRRKCRVCTSPAASRTSQKDHSESGQKRAPQGSHESTRGGGLKQQQQHGDSCAHRCADSDPGRPARRTHPAARTRSTCSRHPLALLTRPSAVRLRAARSQGPQTRLVPGWKRASPR